MVFEDVRVPRENLLGRVGDGAAIALNILNLGRLKLGFGALGTAKLALDLAIAFGKTRKQFGQPIITFDIQRGKLGHLAARIFALDAMSYRVAGDIAAGEERLMAAGASPRAVIDLVRTFALEAAIIKVVGSETLRDVIDGSLKMHGGYGYMDDYQIERLARDNVMTRCLGLRSASIAWSSLTISCAICSPAPSVSVSSWRRRRCHSSAIPWKSRPTIPWVLRQLGCSQPSVRWRSPSSRP